MRSLRLPKSSPIEDCGWEERYFPHLELHLEGRMVLISYGDDDADRRKALRLARKLLKQAEEKGATA